MQTLLHSCFLSTLLTCVLPSLSYAAIEIKYDLRGNGGGNIGHSKTFTNGAYSVTASAWRNTGNGDETPSSSPGPGQFNFGNLRDTFLSQYTNYGIGVEHAVDGGSDNEPNWGTDADGQWLRSNRQSELLSFDLGSEVAKLKKVTFAWVRDRYDEFDLSIDGTDIDLEAHLTWSKFSSTQDHGSIQRMASGGSGGYFTINFPDSLPAGSIFNFYTDDSGDQYKMKKIVFDYLEPEINLPEPTSVLTWALLGLACYVKTGRRL